LEKEPRIRAVNFVADHAVPQPLRMDANLMLASGLRRGTCQRKAMDSRNRLETRHSQLAIRSHHRFDKNRTRFVVAQGLIHYRRRAQFAGQNRQIAFSHLTALHRLLQAARGHCIFGKHDHAAGFAVEPENQMSRFQSEFGPHRTHKARPRSGFRRMANDITRLVDDQQARVLIPHPRTQFGRRDEPYRSLREAAPLRALTYNHHGFFGGGRGRAISFPVLRAVSGFGNFPASAAMIWLRHPLTTMLLPAARACNEFMTTCSQVSPMSSGNGETSKPAALEKFVAVGPGQTARARTPLPRSSSFSAKLQCKRKAFVAP